MSTGPIQEQNKPDPSRSLHPPLSQASKPQRVLSCVLCQQRKVRCDRKFPCTNCIKHQTQCVPATQVRRRRRRLPERELLDRLRKYEELLRQNNVQFKQLHGDPVGGEDESPAGSYVSDDEQLEAEGSISSSTSTNFKSGRGYEPRNYYNVMSQGLKDPNIDNDHQNNGARENYKKAFDQIFDNDDHLLFGLRKTAVDLSTFHPEPVHIFRLWQVYLDNVNPLLKVTHTPSLQGRIIEAAGNMVDIRPALEALMFSIYCMAILSLDMDDCQAMFGLPREDLLTKYRFGCQQALSNCGFLRSDDRDCLTALYLYLVSVRSGNDPRSLHSMLGVAIRIAQRMGIDNESTNTRCTVLEAEMRRRLWWSLMLFDARIGEMPDHKAPTLNPIWDCKIPLNVNDSDLRPEMKEPPLVVHGKATEAIFAVVRSELAEVVRNSPFHLDSTNPALKLLAKKPQEGGDLATLEKKIEEEYLRFCDPENPLHFMTIWTSRAYLAKCRLVEHYSRYPSSSAQQTESQRDAALSHAFSMLECDTTVMASPLTKGYLWHLQFHFPLPAYIHIVQDLRTRPVSKQAEAAWEIMSDNYEARFGSLFRIDSPLFRMFTRIVLQAWEALEAAFKQSGELPPLPRIVASIRQQGAEMAQNAPNAQHAGTEQPTYVVDTAIDAFPMPIPMMPMGFGYHNALYSMGGQDGFTETASVSGVYPNMPGQAALTPGMNQFNWPSMDWGWGLYR